MCVLGAAKMIRLVDDYVSDDGVMREALFRESLSMPGGVRISCSGSLVDGLEWRVLPRLTQYDAEITLAFGAGVSEAVGHITRWTTDAFAARDGL